MPQPNRASDFRYIYTNAFGVGVTPLDLVLRFGIAEDATNPAETTIEQLGVAMTLVSARQLAFVLTEALKRIETDNNFTIPLPPEKVAEILAAMHGGTKGPP